MMPVKSVGERIAAGERLRPESVSRVSLFPVRAASKWNLLPDRGRASHVSDEMRRPQRAMISEEKRGDGICRAR